MSLLLSVEVVINNLFESSYIVSVVVGIIEVGILSVGINSYQTSSYQRLKEIM